MYISQVTRNAYGSRSQAGNIGGHHWITKVRNEVPLEFLAASRQLSWVARCMKGRIINFTKDDDPSSVYM